MADAALLGTGATAAAAAGFLAYEVRGRSATLFGASVYHGDRSRAALALTFDDGPSESTPALLDILGANQIRATFFMCGRNVRRCPEIARQVHAAGHEIGNHTDTHPRLDFRSPEFIYREMALAQETIRATAGVTPKLFRAPYGVRWFGVRSAQQRLGLTGVMWTVVGRDWRWPAERVSQRLLKRASNGGIICLHDGRAIQRSPDVRATINAVKQSIPELKQRGFQFETVSEILCAKQ
jgi:peptidoglycan/xylan/chitin deacetylase (PgdA/CDA1 family)